MYQLSTDAAEPDASIVELNAELAACDECAASTLPSQERIFLLEGLPFLIDSLLVSNSRYIVRANKYGAKKMMRNILALQQNLKNLGDRPTDVSLDRSRKFWEMFDREPKVCRHGRPRRDLHPRLSYLTSMPAL